MNSDYHLVEDGIQPPLAQDQDMQHTFISVFKLVIGRSIFIGLSYLFSLMLFVAGVLASKVEPTENFSLTEITNETTMISEAELETAADALIMSTLDSVTVIASALLFGIGIVVSRLRGRIDKFPADGSIEELTDLKDQVSASNRNSLIITATISFPASTLPLVFSKDILVACGQNPAIASRAQNFLRPFSISLPALMLQMTFEQIILSFQKEKTAMAISLIILLSTTPFSVCLGLGYGLPFLGLTGIAIPFVIGLGMACAAYGILLGYAKDLKEYQFFNCCRLRGKHFSQTSEILKEGGPILLSVFNEIAVFVILNFFAGIISDKALSQLSSVNQFFYFVLILSCAIGQVLTREISLAVGKKNYHTAHSIAKYSLQAIASLLSPICLVAALIYGFTNTYDNWQDICVFPTFVLANLFDILRYNALQQQRALFDSTCASLTSAGCIWSGVGLAAILGFSTSLGSLGLGIGWLAGSVSGLIALSLRLKHFYLPEVIESNHQANLSKSKQSILLCPCTSKRPTRARAPACSVNT